jgi:hypothetical protein
MIAHLLAMKYVLGVPFHRYEQQTVREGFKIDRGTMCRYAEHVGAAQILGGRRLQAPARRRRRATASSEPKS